MAVCGMKCIDLRNEAIKILGIYFPYHQKLKDEKKNIYIYIYYFKYSRCPKFMKNEKSYIRRTVGRI